MERRYYANPTNTTVMRSRGLLPPPEEFREITAAEYEEIRGEPEHPVVRTLAEVRAEQAGKPSGSTARTKAKGK
ncbi:hypothetical protein ACH4RG_23005 [Streptomyces sp. NPDC021019]|uniref:hypothetical protein n=1 Tax=Streptomyces sp. NPDC021019 TaxID=3365108 RepID=UPI00378B35C2